jgi:hypothetical protein
MNTKSSKLALIALAGHILSIDTTLKSLITEQPVLTRNPWEPKVYGAAPGGNDTFKSQFSSPKYQKTKFGTTVKKRISKSR